MENNLKIEEIKIEDLEHYNELMETFKKCFKNEAVQFIKECRDYIISMREDIKNLKEENEVIKADCYKMAVELDKKFKEVNKI